MGERGNIAITQPGAKDTLYLHTHWKGPRVREILASALTKGKERWSHPSYLTRIIFDELVNGDRSLTGYGIDVGQIGDNDYPIPHVGWDEDGHLWVAPDGIDTAVYEAQVWLDRRKAVDATFREAELKEPF